MLKLNELREAKLKTFEVTIQGDDGQLITPIRGNITAEAEDVVYDMISHVDGVDNVEGDMIKNMTKMVAGKCSFDKALELVNSVDGTFDQINQFVGTMGLNQLAREFIIRETAKQIIEPVMVEYLDSVQETQTLNTP